jgi:hypothetical protein
MHQLAQIADIIEETLNENAALGGIDGSAVLAEECARKLVKASLEQLAALVGSNLEVNEDGETILNLGTLL